MTAILLLSVDRLLADRIARAMDGRVPVSLIQSLEPETLEGPGVIILDRLSIPPDRSLAAIISMVAQSSAGRPVVLATEERDAQDVLHAIRAGADDIIPRDGHASDIAPILSRLINSAIADKGAQGRLTLFLGVDREASAMVATDMAIAGMRGRPHGLLIDCTLPTSAAQAYLDLSVDYGIASAVADIERLDASLLANTLPCHKESGLMLLTFDGGTGAEPAGLAPGDMDALIRLLRGCAGDIMLHAGSLRHGGLLRDIAAQADRIELLCAQSIRDVEASRRLIDRIAPDPAIMSRTRLLVWDHQPGILLDSRRMADALGIGAVLPVPLDRIRARNALNAGRPLALEADGGPYMNAIRRASGVTASPSGGITRLRRAFNRVVERTS